VLTVCVLIFLFVHSESEYNDQFSEMTPLVGGNAELAPSSISYDAIDAQRHPLMRIPSEESLNTVFPLPGMVLDAIP